jgi:hypothetical protein
MRPPKNAIAEKKLHRQRQLGPLRGKATHSRKFDRQGQLRAEEGCSAGALEGEEALNLIAEERART